MSAANSLQFNQLIGGAISPSVISSHQNGTSNAASSPMAASAPMPAGGLNSQPNPNNQQQAHMMIGDYVQGNMGNVLANSYRQ